MIYEYEDIQTENSIIDDCIIKLEKMSKNNLKYNDVLKAMKYIKEHSLSATTAINLLRKNNLHRILLTI